MDQIAHQWEFVLHHSDADIREIAQRAAREESLRSLFPYPSMKNLRFSKSTEYPYDPMPYILSVAPGQHYELRGADNRPLLEGTLDTVVAELARIVST